MYDYLDRSTVSLPARHHFLILSARLWALASAFQRCPYGTLAPRFESVGLAAALPHFHRVMVMLNASGVARLELGPPCRETIEEEEAMLLALFEAGGADAAVTRRAAAAMVGDTPALAPLTEALRALATDVAAAGALRDGSGH